MLKHYTRLLLAGLLMAQTAVAQDGPPFDPGNSNTICEGDSIRLSAIPANLYEWVPATGLDNQFSPTPLAGPRTTTNYQVRRLITGGDLIFNGNFELGNTGFTSDYRDSTDIVREGYYRVTNQPQQAQFSFNNCPDKTSGTGNMMVVNGSVNAGDVIWRQTINVSPNTNYAFSAWVNAGMSTGAIARVQFSINGQLIGIQHATRYSPCDWQRFFATWNSGSTTTAVIAIVNQNTVREGNDFALDDIFFESFTSLTDAVTVTVLPALPAPTFTTTDLTPCQGSTVTATGPTGALGYLWNNGRMSPSIDTTQDANIWLRVLGQNGCYSYRSDTAEVRFQPIPGAPVISAGSATVICPGDSVMLTATAADSYEWSDGATTQSIWAKAAGSYTVSAISNAGCQSVSSNAIVVSVRTRPAQPRVQIVGDTVQCTPGASVTLTSNYTTNNVWSTGATTQSITVSAPGSYSVFAQASGGCPSLQRFVTISEGTGSGAAPVITSNAGSRLCSGASLILTSNQTRGNQWSTGDTTQTITVTQGGSFTVTNTTSCGTATSAPFAVTQRATPATPTIIVVGADTVSCVGSTIRLTANVPTGGSLLWSTGQTSDTISVTQTSTITVSAIVDTCQSAPSAPVNLTFNTPAPIPTVTLTGNPTFCQGDSVILTSSGGPSTVWSTGAMGEQIIVTTTESGIQAFVPVAGCPNNPSSPITTAVVLTPEPPVIGVLGSPSVCAGDSVVLSSTAGAESVWSTGQTGATITVIVNVDQQVTAQVVVSGCSSATSAPVMLMALAVPATPQVSPAGPLSLCSGDTAMLIATTPSTTPGSVVWSNGFVGDTLMANLPDVYTAVRVVGACSSAVSNAVSVSSLPRPVAPVISFSGDSSLCLTDTVLLTSDLLGDVTWSDGQQGQTIGVVAPGTYTATTSLNGCTSLPSNALVVTGGVAGPPPVLTLSGPTSFCEGDSLVITSSAGANTFWSTGERGTRIVVRSSATITAIDSTPGCPSLETQPVMVMVTPRPQAPVLSASGLSICQGDSVVVLSSAMMGTRFSTGDTGMSLVVRQSVVLTAVVDSAGCTSDVSNTLTIDVRPAPDQPVITASGPLNLCPGDSVTLTSSAMMGNMWSTGDTTRSITTGMAGTYTVMVMGADCPSPVSAAVVVTVGNGLAAPTITLTGNATFCFGDSVVLTSSVATGNMWSTGDTTQSIVVQESANISLTYSIGDCMSLPASVTITVNNPAAPIITVSGDSAICDGDSVRLISSYPTGNLWSDGSTDSVLVVSVGGSFSVAALVNGCLSPESAPVTITVRPTPDAPVISLVNPADSLVCGSQMVALTSNAPGQTLWSNGMMTDTVKVMAPMMVTATRVVDGCPSMASNMIMIDTLPTPAAPILTPTGPTSVCFGDSVVIYSTAGVATMWSTGDMNVDSVVVRSTQTVTAFVQGTICPGLSASISVTIDNPITPIITASGPLTFCQGDSVILVSSAGMMSAWSTGDTGVAQIIVTETGIYSVSAFAGPCVSPGSASVTVNVNVGTPAPMIMALDTTTFCQGGMVRLVSSVSGTVVWSTGETTDTIMVMTSGRYSVRDTSGTCPSLAADSVTVTVIDAPAIPTITAIGSVVNCTGDSVQLFYDGPDMAMWSTGVMGDTITLGLGIQTVTLTVTNTAGCQSVSAPVLVSIGTTPAAPLVTALGSLTGCQGDVVTLVAQAPAGVIQWIGAPAAGDTLRVTATGNYRAIVTVNGCTSDVSDSLSVILEPIPSTPVIVQTADALEVTGGTVGVTYLWFFNGQVIAGQTTNTLQLSTILDGDYSVIALSTAGCLSDTSTTFTLIRTRLRGGVLASLTLTPNPTMGRATITGLAPGVNLITVTDLTGRTVYRATQAGQTAHTLDLSGMPMGSYMVRVQAADHVMTRQLILTR